MRKTSRIDYNFRSSGKSLQYISVPRYFTAYVIGGACCDFQGLTETGLPGVSIPAVLPMVEAFPDDAMAWVVWMIVACTPFAYYERRVCNQKCPRDPPLRSGSGRAGTINHGTCCRPILFCIP